MERELSERAPKRPRAWVKHHGRASLSRPPHHRACLSQPPMALHKLPTLAIWVWILLALLSLMGEVARGKPCERKYTRYRHPPLQTLQWPGYWVPLMIILGGCCGLAWCILYLTYSISQRGIKPLPQLPSKTEEPPLPLDRQKEWGRTVFQADTDIKNLPMLERNATTGKVGNLVQLERQFTSVGVGTSPWAEDSIIQLKRQLTSVAVGTSPWAEDNLAPKQDRSVIQLEREASHRNTVGTFTQQLKNDVVVERARSSTQLENNTQSEGMGGPHPVEINPVGEKTPSLRQLENFVNERAGSVENQGHIQETFEFWKEKENQGGSRTTLSPSPQGSPDAPSPCHGEDKCNYLWNFMEKELERLLGALRLHRSAGPALPEQESPNVPGEEMPEQPPASETPETEMPEPQAEEASSTPPREQFHPMMQLIICEIPRSRSRSPARGRGRRRRCCSKRRK